MAPKAQPEAKPTESASGSESVTSQATLGGLTIQEWAARDESNKKALFAAHELVRETEAKIEACDARCSAEIGKAVQAVQAVQAVAEQVGRYQAVIGEAMLNVGELAAELTKRPITLADRDRLKQAESTIGALSQWLAQQRSAMAKLLVTEYPAIRIIGEKVMFGNGVFAPKGMVYSRELHPNQFAQIVAERLPDIDYVWESSVKS